MVPRVSQANDAPDAQQVLEWKMHLDLVKPAFASNNSIISQRKTHITSEIRELQLKAESTSAA